MTLLPNGLAYTTRGLRHLRPPPTPSAWKPG
jgi:hypothetical protein